MKFVVDEEIFRRYPGTSIGVAIVRGIDNFGNDARIDQLMRDEEIRIRASFESDTLSQDPRINSWRKVYSSFGAKPKDAKSSVENLYKMVTRGIDIRRINKLVDIYNYICLKHMVPVGGEDVDKIAGNLKLTIAADEKPVQLLGDASPEAPKNGEVIYKDEDSTICRRWNWRECDRTKLTAETKNAVLVIEGVHPVNHQDIYNAVNELSSNIEKFCGGKAEFDILNAEKLEIDLYTK